MNSLDITVLDFSNTEDFSYAFRNCTSIKSLDLSNFNTTKATGMTGTFFSCSSLTSIELNRFPISITSLNELFSRCSSLENISIKVERVQSVDNMFKGCANLKDLDLSEFNGNNIIFHRDFFPQEVTNCTVVYNSSLFQKVNINILIPNEGIIFEDINENQTIF